MTRLLAQINPTTFPTLFRPASKLPNISSALNLLLPLVTIGAALIFLVMVFYASFTWLTAGADTKKVQSAQRILVFAILGFVLIVVSFFAVRLIGFILKINLYF